MSTKLQLNDIKYVYSNAHKTITLDSGSSGVSTVSFLSGSNNITSSTTASSYYVSIDHLFYGTSRGSSNYTPGVYYLGTETSLFPQHKNKFNKQGLSINISTDVYGIYIKPGTFSYYDSTNDVDFILKDDGYGNLYSVDPEISQSAATSISSSDNYVGNIFYEHGLAIITETGSYHSSGSGQFYVSGGTNYSMTFDSTVGINSMEYTCKLLPHEYNWSTNPSLLSGSNDSIVTHNYYESNLFGENTYYDNHGYSGYERVAGRTIPIIHAESMSISRIKDGTINKKYRNNKNFSPYITKIALKNKFYETMMVATFPHPLKKTDKEAMTIKINMDF